MLCYTQHDTTVLSACAKYRGNESFGLTSFHVGNILRGHFLDSLTLALSRRERELHYCQQLTVFFGGSFVSSPTTPCYF
jgi:hypothetical protein